jgi:hypothetical protein
MKPAIRPLAEINRQAMEILIREMGVVDAHRFLAQYQAGSGDYTKERGQSLGSLSFEQIVSEIKARGRKPRRGKRRS